MSDSGKRELIIDPDFKNLIRPLYKQEYLQLEKNIIKYGCREPITLWNGIIVDGHNRYDICTRHGIPFSTVDVSFVCREDAIAWICANQLGRRNLTEEARKYLIGMQYEAEKKSREKKNPYGINQYPPSHGNLPYEEYDPRNNTPVTLSCKKTAYKIAEENGISHGTVEKYSRYSRALEEIGKKEPKLVSKILSGRYKVSHKGVLSLSQLSKKEIQKINNTLEGANKPFVQYQTTRKEIQKTIRSSTNKTPSVKDMPAYDPDAEITGLTLTIPSWTSSIKRVKKESDLHTISDSAKSKLKSALDDLITTINDILNSIEEAEKWKN